MPRASLNKWEFRYEHVSSQDPRDRAVSHRGWSRPHRSLIRALDGNPCILNPLTNHCQPFPPLAERGDDKPVEPPRPPTLGRTMHQIGFQVRIPPQLLLGSMRIP